MTSPGRPDGWEVHGGIDVDADDLYALGEATRRAATTLTGWASALSEQSLVLAGAVALLSPRHCLSSTAAAALLFGLPRDLRECAAALRTQSLALVCAADQYVAAEEGIDDTIRAAGIAVGYARKGRPGFPDQGAFRGADPDSLAEPVADLAALLYSGRQAQVGPREELGVGPPPEGTADLLALIEGRGMDGAEPPPGRIDVTAVTSTGPDGASTTAYVVALPGTSSFEAPVVSDFHSDVRNLEGNLLLMAGRSTAEVAALPSALLAAGVPPGARVMFVGHSQGGMTAYTATGDPTLRSRYQITHCLTAGSPIGAMAAPKGVQVLSLENSRDPVPKLDGRRNPDAMHRTTVRFDGDRGHDLDGYRVAGRVADEATGGSLGEFNRTMRESGFVAPGGGATATLRRVTLTLPTIGRS